MGGNLPFWHWGRELDEGVGMPGMADADCLGPWEGAEVERAYLLPVLSRIQPICNVVKAVRQ